MFQVNNENDDQQTGIDERYTQLQPKPEFPVEENKQEAGYSFDNGEPERYGSSAITAPTAQLQIAKQGDQVENAQLMLAGRAMRGRVNYGLPPGQPVYAHV